MKQLFFVLLLISLSFHSIAQTLQVSADHRRIEFSDGRPFFWLGDTAWELFHRLDREEAAEYLENRAEKGFTVIQAVVLAENDGLRTPNPYGEVPFFNEDPTRPNEAYFEHVDWIVNKAGELGLYIGMLPTWGDKVFSTNPGAGPVVFDAKNAEIYGRYLGERYKDNPVVWILGGDRNIANREVYGIWKAMANGLRQGDDGRHLITYHPRGASYSYYWLHNEPWLDFNMYQSGHEGFNQVYEYAERHAMLHPTKPFVDGEPAYEDIAVRFWEYMDFSKPGPQRVPEGVLGPEGLIADRNHFGEGFISAYDVRVHAYWNFLSGACGYTYGNNAIWQMYKKEGMIAIPALTDWREAMDRPGAQDMHHVRDLFDSRPFGKLIPDQSVIYGINPRDSMHLRAAGSVDGSYAMVYLAVGQEVEIVMDNISGDRAAAWWFNPRSGEASKIGSFDTAGIRKFTPPELGSGNDWLLVLDRESADYPPPGAGE